MLPLQGGKKNAGPKNHREGNYCKRSLKTFFPCKPFFKFKDNPIPKSGDNKYNGHEKI